MSKHQSRGPGKDPGPATLAVTFSRFACLSTKQDDNSTGSCLEVFEGEMQREAHCTTMVMGRNLPWAQYLGPEAPPLEWVGVWLST